MEKFCKMYQKIIAFISIIFLNFFFCLDSHSKTPERFLSITDIDDSIIVDIRYYSENNFVGEKILGYLNPKCILTKEAALALKKVHEDLKKYGFKLRVFDCYRPQKAVDHFVRWSKDLENQKTKKEYYPNVEKKDLFNDGFIAEKSGHSRGSTVDLTIDGFDMGTDFDFFDVTSFTNSPAKGRKVLENRRLLKRFMEKYGFENYEKEWWHYTLKKEPFPDQYFDFDVE